MSEAPQALPEGEPYRVIGPFDEISLPRGLRAEHRLKPDACGVLRLSEGSVEFVWDDGRDLRERLVAPVAAVIPPQVPHHLECDGPFRLTIEFYKV